MANASSPYGLQPLHTIGGGAPFTVAMPMRQKFQTTKYSTKIYKGQLVLFNNTIGCGIANAGTNPTAGTVLGVAAAYYPGSVLSTATEIPMWLAKEHIFVAQIAAATTTKKLSDYYMKNMAITAPTAGSTTTGLSASMLYNASHTASAPFRVIGLAQNVGQTATGAYLNLKGMLNFSVGFDTDAAMHA